MTTAPTLVAPESLFAEVTLDPSDWEDFRRIGHRMIDDMFDHFQSLRTQPAWQPMPTAVRASFQEPIPWRGVGVDAVYQQFRRTVLPYPNGNLHPRFWGWVQGCGTPLGMLADMLAAGMNPHLAGFDQAPVLVEDAVLRWLAELMGLPPATSGVLVGGGTMANLLGLNVARSAKAREIGWDMREDGLQEAGRPRLVAYGSVETHGWVRKAVELMGLGNRSFRPIRTDANDRIDVAALVEAIARDRDDGYVPFCVVGTAGTVNTGATDDLNALADLAQAERLWFHVDGAFGALARLSHSLGPLVTGMERADSLGFDLHKWMCLPFDVACVLVRDPDAHRAAFAATAHYLTPATRGVGAGSLHFADRGVDLTRSFRALKVWMAMKAHGVAAIAQVIEQNVAQAQYLGALIDAHPALERLAPVSLNVVCFRYAPPTVSSSALDDANREILLRVQEAGIAVPSGTIVRGQYGIRVANVNHRTRREDFDALVAAVVHHGREILGG